MTDQPFIAVKIDRDSVCAGDDTDPYETVLALPADATLTDLLQRVTARHFLASVSGGRATWLIGVPAFRKGFIGVLAQQWDTPRLLVSPLARLPTLFAAGEPAVYFTHWLQSDPDAVFACLQAGRALPARYPING